MPGRRRYTDLDWSDVLADAARMEEEAAQAEEARAVLVDFAVESVAQLADHAVATGRARWELDPYVPGVIGLVVTGTDHAAVVIYLAERDFEVDEVLLAELGQEAV